MTSSAEGYAETTSGPVRLGTVRLDLRFDVSNVAEALEIAEGVTKARTGADAARRRSAHLRP